MMKNTSTEEQNKAIKATRATAEPVQTAQKTVITYRTAEEDTE